MAQVRNISSDARMLGDTRVDPDELYTVDDAAFLDRAWPTSIWKLVTSPRSGRDVSISDAIVWTAEEAPAAEPSTDNADNGQTESE